MHRDNNVKQQINTFKNKKKRQEQFCTEHFFVREIFSYKIYKNSHVSGCGKNWYFQVQIHNYEEKSCILFVNCSFVTERKKSDVYLFLQLLLSIITLWISKILISKRVIISKMIKHWNYGIECANISTITSSVSVAHRLQMYCHALILNFHVFYSFSIRNFFEWNLLRPQPFYNQHQTKKMSSNFIHF